jgi:hypothetical protein
MAKVRWRQQIFRFAAGLLGIALLVSVICGTGPSRVVDQVKAVGWGLGLVIALGGIAHLTHVGLAACGIDPGIIPTSTVPLSLNPISADTVSVVLSVEGSAFLPPIPDPMEPKSAANDVHRFTSPTNHGYTGNI